MFGLYSSRLQNSNAQSSRKLTRKTRPAGEERRRHHPRPPPRPRRPYFGLTCFNDIPATIWEQGTGYIRISCHVAFFTQGVGAKDTLADRNTIRQTYLAQTPNFTCAELDLNCYLKAKTVHANILSSKILHSTRGVRAAFITPHDTHHLQLPIPTCAPIVGKSNHFFLCSIPVYEYKTTGLQ